MVVYKVKAHERGWSLLRNGLPTAEFKSAQTAVAMAMKLVDRERKAGQQARIEELEDQPEPAGSRTYVPLGGFTES